jgi:hypothetical protein
MSCNRNALLAIAGILTFGGLYGQDSIAFRCQDLPDAGLILVPPSSPDYARLLKDIQYQIAALPVSLRLAQLTGEVKAPGEQPNTAILLNKSAKSIVSIEVQWRYEYASGRTMSFRSFNTTPILRDFLLPITPASDPVQRQRAYWYAILPGSRRYISESGIAGVNTDVRPPNGEEIWTGPLVSFGGMQRRRLPPNDTVRSVTLILDGIFFQDGEFVGPDAAGLWESVTSEARMRLAIAKIASAGKASETSSDAIFEEIAEITGPPPDTSTPGGNMHPPPKTPAEFEKDTAMRLASSIEQQRHNLGDDRVIQLLAAAAGSPKVDFRRR